MRPTFIESNGCWEIPVGRRLYEVRVRRIDGRRFQIQDTDSLGHLAWYSECMRREDAMRLALARKVPEGWASVVRHVGTGEVVLEIPAE